MTLRWISVLPAALLLICTQALADESKIVQIRVDGAPKFDVIYHRALTNGTGGAIAGLIGVGIQMGIESDRDAKKREALGPHVSAGVWNDVFVKTLNEALQTKGFDPLWLDGKAEPQAPKADVYLTLFPASYGFRMVDSNTALVSAYVEFDAVYSRELHKPRQKLPKEAFYMTNKKQSSYDDLAKEPAALSGDVESVLAQAARRLANKIIYNVK
jgi:hypothetical protein